MGQEGAYQSLAAAVRGEDIPYEHRQPHIYSDRDIQGGHGSAQIPLMHAVNDMWWNYHHGSKARADEIAFSWIGYFEIDRWMTKEPYGTHVYHGWIQACYHSVRLYAFVTGNNRLLKLVESYLLYTFCVYALAGFYNLRHNQIHVTLPGARSWVGRGGPPYPHLVGLNSGQSSTLEYILGFSDQMTSFSADVLRESRHVSRAFKWFDYIPLRMKSIAVKITQRQETREDLQEFLDVMKNTGAKAYIPITFIRTSSCNVVFCNRSWSSGSTSFLYAKAFYENGRPRSNTYWYEPWADSIDNRYGWLAAAGYHRIADPGGHARLSEIAGNYRVECQTLNEGPNPKKIGPDKSFIVPTQSWWDERVGGTTDPRAWKSGWRSIPVQGEIERMVHIDRFARKFQILKFEGEGGGPVTPPGNGNGDNVKTEPGSRLLFRVIDRANRIAASGGDHRKAAKDPEYQRLYKRWLEIISRG